MAIVQGGILQKVEPYRPASMIAAQRAPRHVCANAGYQPLAPAAPGQTGGDALSRHERARAGRVGAVRLRRRRLRADRLCSVRRSRVRAASPSPLLREQCWWPSVDSLRATESLLPGFGSPEISGGWGTGTSLPRHVGRTGLAACFGLGQPAVAAPSWQPGDSRARARLARDAVPLLDLGRRRPTSNGSAGYATRHPRRRSSIFPCPAPRCPRISNAHLLDDCQMYHGGGWPTAMRRTFPARIAPDAADAGIPGRRQHPLSSTSASITCSRAPSGKRRARAKVEQWKSGWCRSCTPPT